MRSQVRLQVLLPALVLLVAGLAAGAFVMTNSPTGNDADTASPEPAPQPTQQPEPAPPELEPTKLEKKLAKRGVVVVVLYTPDSAVDAKAVREARAGAKKANVGFMAVDVTDEATAAEIVPDFDGRDAPALLVVQRDKTIVTHIVGFADREVVAQAAENATFL